MIDMHPPAVRRCQIYGDTSVRCVNDGTHWVKWGGGCSCNGTLCSGADCEKGFYSWECDGEHLFGEAA